jgi:hypothetical protein
MGEILPTDTTVFASLMEKEKPKWRARRKKGFDTRNQGTMVFLGIDSGNPRPLVPATLPLHQTI